MSEEEKLPAITKQSREGTHQSQEKEQLTSSKPRYNSLSIVKKARKQVEEDARLLQNRIALLKQEEIRNYKKIDEIKKKAIEVYSQKVEIEKRQKKKQIVKRQELESKKEKAKIQRDTNMAEKLNKKELFEMQKILRRQEIQQQKAKNKLKKDFFEKKVREEKQIRNQLIKQQEQSGREKLQQFYDQKLQYFREMHELTINEEDYARQKKYNEIKKMEKLETDLIYKLQQSQAFQKQAFQELEQALILPPREFADKFLQPSEQPSKLIKEENNDDKSTIIDKEQSSKKQTKSIQYKVKVISGTFEELNEEKSLLIQINEQKTNAIQGQKTIEWNSDFITLQPNQQEFYIKLFSLIDNVEEELGSGQATIKNDEKIKDVLNITSSITQNGKNIASILMEISQIQN